MAPTERAIALLAPAQRILNDTQTLLAAPEEFDPLAMRGTIQIAVPDFLSATLLAAIIGAIRAEAPQSTVRLRAVRSDADGAELLESGRADVLIESSVLPSAAIRYATLFEDSILAVAARGNPHATARLTCEEYLRLPHVAAAPASGLSPGMIDRMLAKQGHSRRVVAWVPYLNILPSVLAGSDLVFTTTAHLARHFASRPDLKTFVPPIAFPGIHYFLMWHECAHRSGKHVWLRNLIRHAVSTATVG